jgi:hypothetical protein
MVIYCSQILLVDAEIEGRHQFHFSQVWTTHFEQPNAEMESQCSLAKNRKRLMPSFKLARKKFGQ